MNVSVIIPAFNAADTFEKTLDSLRTQTIGSWEAIVVDDGSTDRTGEIAKVFAAADARFRMIRQANSGMTVARNNAIARASFDWVCFLDSDDWILPSYIERMTVALESDPSLDAVHCGWANVAPEGVIIGEANCAESGDLFHLFAKRCAFVIHSCIVRRSLVESVGCFDTSVHVCADWDIWQRIARAGARFGAIPDVLAFYRLRPLATWINSEKYLAQGFAIIKRGHSPDPRVPFAIPAHSHGLPEDDLPGSLYVFVCWPAAFALGRGEDARPLLDALGGLKHPELDPDAVARAVFYGALLPRCQPPGVWESLLPAVEQNVDLFLTELENRSGATGLALQARAILEKMIGVKSPRKFRGRLILVRKRIGRMLGLPQVRMNPVPALRRMTPFNRLSGLKRILEGDRRQADCRALILMYHRVNEISPDPWDLCVSPKHFAEHLEVLKTQTHPVSFTGLLESFYKGKVRDRSVVVTFDDGYADNFLQANPLLERHRIPAIFFLVSSLIGSASEFWWDELDHILFQPCALPEKLRLEIDGRIREWDLGPASRWNPADAVRHCDWKYYRPLPSRRHQVFCDIKDLLKRLPNSHRKNLIDAIREWAGVRAEVRPNYRALSPREVIKLASRGLNEIGSHTATHPVLSALPVDAQREEIARGKSELETLLNRSVRNFAYPYGDPSVSAVEIECALRETGFRSACSTSEGVVHKHSNLFHLPRYMVLNWDGKTFYRQLSCWFNELKGPA
jgi:peptidoglycan/xylan/chitin deacetylase (PgdA/CDA1 family)